MISETILGQGSSIRGRFINGAKAAFLASQAFDTHHTFAHKILVVTTFSANRNDEITYLLYASLLVFQKLEHRGLDLNSFEHTRLFKKI